MKVFVRTDSLGGPNPVVVGMYSDDAEVAANAHGADVTLLNLPRQAIKSPLPSNMGGEGGPPTLAIDWRQAARDMPVRAEAKRRIEEAFPASDQLSILCGIIDAVLQHGTDMSNWPADARQRKAEFDKKWKYVAEVQERLKTHVATMPGDPSSDKNWPRRITKP